MSLSHIQKFCLAVLLFTALVLVEAGNAAPESTARPNIIFVLIDDMGYGDLSCYGGNAGQTPHIDKLAKEGIQFSQFYAGAPICSPSRTALLTGQSPVRWRITSFLSDRAENQRRDMAQWLDPKAPSLARTLQQAGYATGHFGKWHMGGQRDVGEAPLITEYGFDESLSNFEGLGDRVLPLLDAFDGQTARKYSLGSEHLGRGKIEWMDRSQVTAAFVQRTIDFIGRAEKNKKPFYVNVWPDDVHSPFFPPKALRTDEAKRELYLSVLKAMDEQLGQLFDHVRKSPSLRANTIIVLASDNGPEPGAGSAGRFRGHKGMLYEGGIREPLIVWGPGFMTESSRSKINETTVVSSYDFFPSIARLAGCEVPTGMPFEGEDLSPVFLGLTDSKRLKPLFWSRPPDRPGNNGKPWPDLAVREDNWKLLVMKDGTGAQLFDLAKDPGEENDVASKHPEVVSELRSSVLSWWRAMPRNEVPDASELTGGGR